MTGSGSTLTVTVVVSLQPFVVPTTEYTVVAVGLATGDTHVVHDKLAAGIHKYEAAPATCRCVLELSHIVVSLLAVTTGISFVNTVTDEVSLQPFTSVPVIK